jgi:hypothetical protein
MMSGQLISLSMSGRYKMTVEQVKDGSWLAYGDGYDRRIVAEGGTRGEARYNFEFEFGNQYAAAQTLTHLSLVRSWK